MKLRPASTLGALRTPIFDPKTGQMSLEWVKWFQNAEQKLWNGLDANGQVIGAIDASVRIAGRTETIGATVQNLDSEGIMLGPGIDFARPYVHKDTDHIADASGSPLEGGRAAFRALVASPPALTPHNWLNGLVGGVFTESQPDYSDLSGRPTLPATTPPVAHEWLTSYDAATGAFAQARPDYADLTGTPTGASGTITLAALTGGGTNGSITVVNGIITAFVDPT